jgi:hypothetical protein
VIIIWDLYPAWREDGEKPNMSADREAVTKSLTEEGIAQCLKDAKVAAPAVRVLCIDRMLETWLHIDGRALTDAINSRSRTPVSRIKDKAHPQHIAEPKQHLDKLYREHCFKPYTDHVHALDIVKHITDLSKLTCCPSFKRFVDLLA